MEADVAFRTRFLRDIEHLHEQLLERLNIPEELARREERLKTIREAKAAIEARAAERFAHEQAGYEAKGTSREEQTQRSGKKPRGGPSAPPTPGPRAEDPINLTDPDSRIMARHRAVLLSRATTRKRPSIPTRCGWS